MPITGRIRPCIRAPEAGPQKLFQPRIDKGNENVGMGRFERHGPIVPAKDPYRGRELFGSFADRERCLEAGMDDYISKPVKIESIRGTLENWLSPPPEELASIPA